ncbi:TPA: restriction endonuclease subunit S [Corynebacterium striatum]|nr:restriction endonuclease subunit S [Corynebacterium striatum]
MSSPFSYSRSNLPEGWDKRRLGSLLQFRNGQDISGTDNGFENYPVYGSGGEFKRTNQYLFDGPSILFGRKGTIDKPLLVDGRFWTVDTMFYTVPGPDVDPRFVHYWALVAPLSVLSTNTAVPSMTSTDLAQLYLAVPPLPIQRAIADYLDRETAEIDDMRADLDEIEQLLETRRETIIGTLLASTPSAHCPIAVAADVTLGKMVQPTQKDSSERLAPYLRAAHIPQPGTLDTSVEYKEMWFAPREMELLTVRKGDVVVVEGGAGYGRSALICDDMKGWGFQNSIVRIRAFESLAHGPFIAYALRHAQALGKIEIAASTATLPHFTAEKVSRFRIPLPPLTEQRRIADEIDRETAEIDSMLEDITKLRDLLAERRAAVISAAVTGQIDIPVAPTYKDESHA